MERNRTEWGVDCIHSITPMTNDQRSWSSFLTSVTQQREGKEVTRQKRRRRKGRTSLIIIIGRATYRLGMIRAVANGKTFVIRFTNNSCLFVLPDD